MSALSESLERQLRKLTAPVPEVEEVEPLIPSIKMDVHLVYQEGTSDKEYLVQLVSVGNGGHEVHFQYGRRGKNLIKGTKTPVPVTYMTAVNIYCNLVDEKKAKGYREK